MSEADKGTQVEDPRMTEKLKKMAFGNLLSLTIWNMGVMSLSNKSKAPLVRFILFKNGRELTAALYEAKKMFADFLAPLKRISIYFDGAYPTSEEIWHAVHAGFGFFSLPHDPGISVKELASKDDYNYLLEKMEAAFETDEERKAFDDFTKFMKERIFVEVLLREN